MYDPREILGPGGFVARKLPGYELRPQQLRMAEAVHEALRDGQHLLVEAGTGVGKSFAYLVPAILASAAGEDRKRVVVSTHTINLQEQLVHKDIPTLQAALPVEFTAVLAKGRSNYISLRRMEVAYRKRHELLRTPQELEQLEEIRNWASKTEDGSLSDLSFTPLPQVWSEVRSESDNCMGKKCPFYNSCFYFQARRRLANANIVIVNHALFFVDLALRQSGGAVLPSYRAVVLDEAHTVEEVAARHFGAEITAGQFEYNLRRLYNPRGERGLVKLLPPASAEQLKHEIGRVHSAFQVFLAELEEWLRERAEPNGRVRRPPSIDTAVPSELVVLAAKIRDALEGAGSSVAEEEAQEIEATADRLVALANGLRAWLKQSDEDHVYWVEQEDRVRGRRIRLCSAPIETGRVLRSLLFDEVPSAIMTSATLCVGKGDFSFIKDRLGLNDHPRCRSLQLGSPFRYSEQVVIYIVEDMPDPNDQEEFEPALARALKVYLKRTQGRALVLFTSYRTMQSVARRVRSWMKKQEMTLLVQGENMPRWKLLEAFKSRPNAVLFGTESFWQGIDVPGAALQNVIITRLPFRVPDHPLIQARVERIQELGGNAFLDYQVPEAILRFKQGFGRLIRTSTDRGIIVLLDPRVLSRAYGRLFLDSLPDCPRVIERLAELERPDTAVSPRPE